MFFKEDLLFFSCYNGILILAGWLSMIHFVFPYGSAIYGTRSEFADLDFIVVSDEPTDWDSSLNKVFQEKFDAYPHTKMDINHYTPEGFKQGLEGHEISFLECLFLSPELMICTGALPNFVLSLPLLRESISKKASNSWVKAKKKLVVAEDYDDYIARKSLFHSLRILAFGQQIAEFGRIVDYSAANHYWDEIKSLPADWELWNEKYKPIYNAEATKFKALAPK